MHGAAVSKHPLGNTTPMPNRRIRINGMCYQGSTTKRSSILMFAAFVLPGNILIPYNTIQQEFFLSGPLLATRAKKQRTLDILPELGFKHLQGTSPQLGHARHVRHQTPNHRPESCELHRQGLELVPLPPQQWQVHLSWPCNVGHQNTARRRKRETSIEETRHETM